jgi:16S rRNA (guanine(966)-N(2))-methyltransferase RsmD
MRIIGGACKGKQIEARGLTVRPTTDFAKEGLFNILSSRYDVSSLYVLDLFSGIGSISFEFASRGCAGIHAVEIDPRHSTFIRSASARLGFRQIRVIRDDAFHFLTICKAGYDLIFADPPYDLPRIEEIPDRIFEYDHLLKPDGLFILEHSRRNSFAGRRHLTDQRNYGNVHFSFFKK